MGEECGALIPELRCSQSLAQAGTQLCGWGVHGQPQHWRFLSWATSFSTYRGKALSQTSCFCATPHSQNYFPYLLKPRAGTRVSFLALNGVVCSGHSNHSWTDQMLTADQDAVVVPQCMDCSESLTLRTVEAES